MLVILGPRTLSSASNTFVLGDGSDCGMSALKMLANCGINVRGASENGNPPSVGRRLRTVHKRTENG